MQIQTNMNSGELYYYLFIITLDRWDGSFNILGDPFGRICVLKKAEDVSLKVFNMIKGINASKTIVKNISCKCRCEFDGRKCISKQTWNNDNCWWKSKKNNNNKTLCMQRTLCLDS